MSRTYHAPSDSYKRECRAENAERKATEIDPYEAHERWKTIAQLVRYLRMSR